MGLLVFYKRALITCSMLCCISLFTHAQDTLSLRRAIDIALKNSLDIELARNDIEAATIFNNYGYAGGLPLVTGTVTDNEQVTSVNQKLNTGTSIKRNNASGNQLTAGVTGSILLYNGGRVIATKKRLEELEKQSNHRLTGQIQNTIADVMTAYYDIVRQQNYIKTIDRSIDASNQQLTIVKTRQNVGLANNADLFQAQIDLNALQQSRQAQELIVAQAKSELLRLLTLKADSLVQIQDTIMVDNNIMLQNVLDNIPKSADIVAAEDQIRINELIVKETQALRYPSVRALAGYSFSRNQAGAGQTLFNQSFGPTVGVSLGIPIFNGSIYRRQAQVAKIDVRNADVQKQVLFRDYNANAVKQYQSYVANLQQLDYRKRKL
jgi:outer membrane protein